MTDSGAHDELPGRAKGYDTIKSSEAELMDTVANLQLEVEALKFGQLGQSTLARHTSPVRSKPVVLTSTKAPKFGRMTSWDQYRQVFDAIVQSNGWDDATVALQLLSHLEGDALNVALLVPEVKRTTRAGLIGALREYYVSPGRLADYRRQFDRTARKEGEDPSIYAIAVDTLAVKAFGDMGPTRDSASCVTGLSPNMTIVLCDEISIVFRRRLLSGTLWTIVECGRATRTPVPGELLNRGRRGLYRYTKWTNRGGGGGGGGVG